eukprot:CAMPEP_0117435262 /NCGR_PEP_ID=MMETSP0759-20121206/387_1 /TAXON_ID=63605 /ORGANISM="Percolomonas cosmopolitus, Strain WS" /LENGTH=478 /DNA_ID=CAMNT_0005226797 /DNA_START=199 /DNA_END=1634 /DNA_ORIENTATION=-
MIALDPTPSLNFETCLLSHCWCPTHHQQAQFFAQRTKKSNITKIRARQILDSRGNPTVEVDVYCGDKLAGRASAPSGASTGSNEARELRDGGEKFMGKAVSKAVENVNTTIAEVLKGKDVLHLKECDQAMLDKDGTNLKENLGGNAITATSFAIAAAGANIANEELFIYLAKQFYGREDVSDKKFALPTPMVNILNGGKHAGGKLKIQEFMIVPRSDILFSEQLRQVSEVYHHLGKLLAQEKGAGATNVGDEGGFAPPLNTPDEALNIIEKAIGNAGYKVGEDIFLALDCAASEFYDKDTQKYEAIEKKKFSSDEMVEFYEKMVKDHPAMVSIEDPLDEKDYEGWAKMTARLGDRVQIVGDDLYTTNVKYIKEGIEKKWANALLLKVNQIGAISEAMDAARLVFEAKQNVIVSHRSGETMTTLISDLAVATNSKYIKTGATARGERVSKYNRLLQIEEYLKDKGLLRVRTEDDENNEE